MKTTECLLLFVVTALAVSCARSVPIEKKAVDSIAPGSPRKAEGLTMASAEKSSRFFGGSPMFGGFSGHPYSFPYGYMGSPFQGGFYPYHQGFYPYNQGFHSNNFGGFSSMQQQQQQQQQQHVSQVGVSSGAGMGNFYQSG